MKNHIYWVCLFSWFGCAVALAIPPASQDGCVAGSAIHDTTAPINPRDCSLAQQ